MAGAHIHSGRDKSLNKAMVQALDLLLRDDPASPEVAAEKKLSFAQLIPDIKIETATLAHCVEFAWRKGEYLDTGNRSEVAQYILTKLRNYAREMGWYRD